MNSLRHYLESFDPVWSMKVVVAGSRDFPNPANVRFVMTGVMRSLPKDALIIHGAARGVDTWAGDIADMLGLEVLPCPAAWDAKGKAAGFIRNSFMAYTGTHLIAFWNGHSRGTQDMISTMRRLGKSVAVYTP